MVDIGAVEQMSLVEVMGALTERGIDFTGCFDKTLLLQKLVETMQAQAPHAAAAPPPVVASQEDVLDALLDGAAPQPSDLLVIGNAHQRRRMEEALGRAMRMEDEPEPEPEPLALPAGLDEHEQVTVANGMRIVSRSVMGQTIWPSATVLADVISDYLAAASRGAGKRNEDVRGLEIGAGAGLPALAAARSGYDVVATDFDDDVIEILKVNARLNGLLEVAPPTPGRHPLRPPRGGAGDVDRDERARQLASGGAGTDAVLDMARGAQGARLSKLGTERGCCRPRTLDWTDRTNVDELVQEFPGRFDVVFGSDVVYASADIRPLLHCAVGLLRREPGARLVLAMMLKMFGDLSHTLEARAMEHGLMLLPSPPFLCTSDIPSSSAATADKEVSGRQGGGESMPQVVSTHEMYPPARPRPPKCVQPLSLPFTDLMRFQQEWTIMN
jgi:predicted nicotinamide N-methyase